MVSNSFTDFSRPLGTYVFGSFLLTSKYRYGILCIREGRMSRIARTISESVVYHILFRIKKQRRKKMEKINKINFD